MLCYYGFFLAQVQTANVIAGFAVVVAFAGGIISYGSLKLMKNKMIQENKDKMASKIFVRQEVAKVEVKALNISKQLDEHKHSNEREHDTLKKDIDRKLDLIIELVKSKSA